MKLHRNAALSWNGRRQLAVRVVEQGSTVAAAAAAFGISVRCARKWVGRYKAAGEAGLIDHSSAPRRVANRTPRDREAVILRLRQLRMTAAEIAETLAMPLSTVSVVLRRNGVGRLGRIGLEQAVRYERSRPGELVHIDVKKLGRIKGGAGKRWRDGKRQHANPTYTDAAGNVRRTRLGVRPRRRRRLLTPRLRRSAARRESLDRRRLPAPRRRPLPTPRHHGRTDPHRQRRLLPRRRPCRRLPPTTHQTPPHTPLPATNQRQSRTLHPHPDQRLGLRRHLPLKPRTHPRP